MCVCYENEKISCCFFEKNKFDINIFQDIFISEIILLHCSFAFHWIWFRRKEYLSCKSSQLILLMILFYLLIIRSCEPWYALNCNWAKVELDILYLNQRAFVLFSLCDDPVRSDFSDQFPLHNIIFHYFKSCSIMLYYVFFCNILSYYGMLCYVILTFVILHNIVLYCSILYHITVHMRTIYHLTLHSILL